MVLKTKSVYLIALTIFLVFPVSRNVYSWNYDVKLAATLAVSLSLNKEWPLGRTFQDLNPKFLNIVDSHGYFPGTIHGV